MSLEAAGCRYADCSDRAVWLVRQYQLFVEDGNTPLHECPYWMVEVGRLIARYRARMRIQQEADRYKSERTEQLLKQFSPKS